MNESANQAELEKAATKQAHGTNDTITTQTNEIEADAGPNDRRRGDADYSKSSVFVALLILGQPSWRRRFSPVSDPSSSTNVA